MVVIIDYGMGNVASVLKAVQKLGAVAIISSKLTDIAQATRLILPGVGAFGDGMKHLQARGLVDALYQKVIQERTPFLGICLGMQLLADSGTEFGNHSGLGWISGRVVRLVGAGIRLPHVGWNDIEICNDSVLFGGVTDPNFYFVHSYHMDCLDKSIVTARCRYGQEFVAALQQGHIFATQFHPEKSQTSGLRVLQNFLESPHA